MFGRFSPLLGALIVSLLPIELLGLPFVELIVRIGLLVAAAFAIGRSRRHIWIPLLLVAPVIAFQLLPLATTSTVFRVFALGSGTLFLSYVAVLTLVAILKSKRVDRDVLMGGIAVFLVLGMIWAIGYATLDLLQPGSFSAPSVAGSGGIPYQYFSFVTLTTLGYGDIVPVTALAKRLVVLEALMGQIYIAVFIGRLVGVSFDGGSD